MGAPAGGRPPSEYGGRKVEQRGEGGERGHTGREELPRARYSSNMDVRDGQRRPQSFIERVQSTEGGGGQDKPLWSYSEPGVRRELMERKHIQRRMLTLLSISWIPTPLPWMMTGTRSTGGGKRGIRIGTLSTGGGRRGIRIGTLSTGLGSLTPGGSPTASSCRSQSQ